MYDLGEQFNMDLEKAKANPKCVFKGEKYRITVLTDRLIRLEYQKDGQFVDQPSELAWYRNFEKPYFLVKEDSRYLEIKSKYFKLSYVKNQPFQGSARRKRARCPLPLPHRTLRNNCRWRIAVVGVLRGAFHVTVARMLQISGKEKRQGVL